MPRRPPPRVIPPESAVEPSLFDTLVAAVDAHRVLVRAVFERYCMYSDAFNVTMLSLPNFKKFARDCSIITDQKSDAKFELLFTKCTSRLKGDSARLSLSMFTAILARIVIDLQPDVSVESSADCVQQFMRTHFSRANRLEPLPPCDELLRPEVAAVFREHTSTLQRVRAAAVLLACRWARGCPSSRSRRFLRPGLPNCAGFLAAACLRTS